MRFFRFRFLRKILGLFGDRSPAGPTRFEQTILIAAPADHLYPLVDWADERHLWRQLGHQVTGGGDRFTLRVEEMAGHRFEIAVTDARPDDCYACDSTTLPMIGKLVSSHEEYRFVPVGDGACRVTLTVDAQFVPGLPPRAWRKEQWMMDVSLRNALRKLKLMAEDGLGAVEQASRRLIV